MIRSINDIYKAIKEAEPKRVAVAQAADSHALHAINEAYLEGYAKPVLVGDIEKIKMIAAQENIDISTFTLVQVDKEDDCGAKAVELVHNKEADVVMKGNMQSSSFLRAVLSSKVGIKKANTVVYTIAVAELKKLDRLIFITDLGIIPLPDLDTKIKLIDGTVEILKKFHIDNPNVAALSSAETVSEKMASSYEGHKLEELNKEGIIKDCTVAGPISFDLAMSEESAIEKGYNHPAAGKADILLMPSIEVGNVLYKSLMLFSEMESGGIMAGTTAPVVFCSRADSAQTKKNTLAMAIYLAE